MRKIRRFSIWDIPLPCLLIAAIISLAFAVWIVVRDFKNPTFVELPEECVIETRPRHAPCLIDLTTGEVGELQIFRENLTGELDPVQQWGVFTYQFCGPDTIMAIDKDNGWAEVTVGHIEEKPRLYTAYKNLCEADREAIYTLVQNNLTRWILADLYHVGEPTFYILEPGEYDIRDYHLDVAESELQKDQYVIEMTTDLFEEEREALSYGA